MELTDVHLLNGGLYPDLHRPQPTQLALLDPEQGPKLSAMLNEELMTAGLSATFAPEFDAAADSAAIWRGISRGDGHQIAHRLIRYMRDREDNEQRWVDALEGCDLPVSFTWGMLDPVSGAHMAARIRERLPAAPFRALPAVSHWPQLEAPDLVLADLRGD